jgi:hypothetical protein
MQKARIAIVLLLMAAGGVACGTATPGSSVLDTPDPSLDACRVDADCVLAIRVDICCPCPEVTTHVRVQQAKAVQVYTPGRDYGPLQPASCANVACAPCPPLPEALTCDAGHCRAAEPLR